MAGCSSPLGGSASEGIHSPVDIVSPGGAGDGFGVVLASDGDFLAVAAPEAGRVDVFQGASAPRLVATLTGAPSFGASLAAGRGALLVGCPGCSNGQVAVYDFAKLPNPIQVILATDSESHGFGQSILLAGDRLFVATSSNRVNVFRHESSWVSDGNITGPTGATVFASAFLNGEALVSCRACDPWQTGSATGAITVYSEKGGWGKVDELPVVKNGTGLGQAVLVLGDLLIATYHETPDSLDVTMYLREQGHWVPAGHNELLRRGGGEPGAELLIGDKIWIGTPETPLDNGTTGAISSFIPAGGNWTYAGRYVAPNDVPGTRFGTSLVPWQNLLAVGAPGLTSKGHVYLLPA